MVADLRAACRPYPRDGSSYNNALPLIVALASVAAGRPPPSSEPPQDLGFLDAFLVSSLVQLTIFLPFILMFAVAVWRSGAWERQVIRDELASEAGRTITEDEYQDVVRDNVFRIDWLRPRESAALVNAQHELAFRKRRVKDADQDPERDPMVARWRYLSLTRL
jgi:hypothetical protein